MRTLLVWSCFVALRPSHAFVDVLRPARGTICLFASNKPLASEGDWTAYLDEDNTGFVYYFNGETGESLWEKPTPSFPDVKLVGSVRRKACEKQSEYLQTLQEDKKGFFLSILQAPAEKEKSQQTKQEQQKEKQESSDWFGGLFEDAKAKQKEEGFLSGMFSKSEAAVQEPVVTKDKAPVLEEKKDLFGGMFGGKREKTRPSAEDKVPVVEEKKNIFGGMFGGKKEKSEPPMEEPVITEDKALEVEEKKEPFAGMFGGKTEKSESSVEMQQVLDETPASIETASYVLPHPAKVRWGGEDAVFVKGRTFGIFDGVSGAEKRDGIPLYSRTLAEEMKKLVNENGLSMQELTACMQKCAEIADENATGASTAVVASITEDGFLRALNLGDSACLVIRDNKILAKTREISHYFDCPYQLSVDSPDRPRDGTKLNIELMKGDLILMGSDGIFDNLTEEQLLEVAQSETQISKLARRVSEVSRKVSLDRTAATPYAIQAKKFGDPDFSDGLGGKVDDVSCVVVSYK